MAKELENYLTEYMTMRYTMTWEIQIKELTLLDQFLEDLICIHTQDGVALAVNQVIQVMIINGRKYFTTNVAQKHVIIFKSYVIYNFQLCVKNWKSVLQTVVHFLFIYKRVFTSLVKIEFR